MADETNHGPNRFCRAAGAAGACSRSARGRRSRARMRRSRRRQSRRPRRLPDLAGKTTTAASLGGAPARAAAPAAGSQAAAAPAAIRRHVALAHTPRLDGPCMGRVLRRVGRGARRHRPLHVSERAQRAAAAVQGRFPVRIRHGRRRAVEGEVRCLDRPHRPTTWSSTPAASTRCSSTCTHLGCTPNYLSAESKFKCPCHGSGFRRPASTSKVRRRVRSSARASCWPTMARSCRQVAEVPVRARTVGRPRGVPEGLDGSSGHP